MARLFFHRPRFGVLDECTNATSVDVEEVLYRHAAALGITLVRPNPNPSPGRMQQMQCDNCLFRHRPRPARSCGGALSSGGECAHAAGCVLYNWADGMCCESSAACIAFQAPLASCRKFDRSARLAATGLAPPSGRKADALLWRRG